MSCDGAGEGRFMCNRTLGVGERILNEDWITLRINAEKLEVKEREKPSLS